MNIPDLPPTKLIPWLRKQAAEMTDLANRMEKIFGVSAKPETTTVGFRAQNAQANPAIPLTVDALAENIKSHGGRVNHVAARLGVPEEDIYALIDKSEGRIYAGDRGWLKVKDELSDVGV